MLKTIFPVPEFASSPKGNGSGLNTCILHSQESSKRCVGGQGGKVDVIVDLNVLGVESVERWQVLKVDALIFSACAQPPSTMNYAKTPSPFFSLHYHLHRGYPTLPSSFQPFAFTHSTNRTRQPWKQTGVQSWGSSLIAPL